MQILLHTCFTILFQYYMSVETNTRKKTSEKLEESLHNGKACWTRGKESVISEQRLRAKRDTSPRRDFCLGEKRANSPSHHERIRVDFALAPTSLRRLSRKRGLRRTCLSLALSLSLSFSTRIHIQTIRMKASIFLPFQNLSSCRYRKLGYITYRKSLKENTCNCYLESKV